MTSSCKVAPISSNTETDSEQDILQKMLFLIHTVHGDGSASKMMCMFLFLSLTVKCNFMVINNMQRRQIHPYKIKQVALLKINTCSIIYRTYSFSVFFLSHSLFWWDNSLFHKKHMIEVTNRHYLYHLPPFFLTYSGFYQPSHFPRFNIEQHFIQVKCEIHPLLTLLYSDWAWKNLFVIWN